MNRRLSLIVLGAVTLVLACGTLFLAAGLWAGISWIREQVQVDYGGPGMMWNGPSLSDDMPCAQGYSGPGMMWNGPSLSDDMPCAQGYGGPGMMGGHRFHPGWNGPSERTDEGSRFSIGIHGN